MIRHAEPIPLQFVNYTTGATTTNGSINLAMHATGDLGVFVAPFKMEIQEAGAVVKVGFVGSAISSAKIKMDKRVNCGSDSSRGDGDIAELNFGVTGASAQGACVYDLAGQGVMVEPGQEVVVEGWYRRRVVPLLEMVHIEAPGFGRRVYRQWLEMGGAVVIAAFGAVVLWLALLL